MPSRSEEVEVRVKGTVVIVKMPLTAGGALPTSWQVFSAVEVSVLRALLERGPLSREQLANAINEPLDGKLKFLLPNLVARRVLINTDAGLDLNADAAGRELLGSLLAPPGSP